MRDGLPVQTVVKMCSHDGSKVAAAGWVAPWNSDSSLDVLSARLNSRGCRMDGTMEQTVVTMYSLHGSTVAAVGWMVSLMRQLYLHCGYFRLLAE